MDMQTLLPAVGLILNTIGAIILIGTSKSLIEAIIHVFENIKNNDTWSTADSEHWFPDGWDDSIRKTTRSSIIRNTLGLIFLIAGFVVQAFPYAKTIICSLID